MPNDGVPKLFTVCRVNAQEPMGKVMLSGNSNVRDSEELAHLCRAMYLEPSVLAGCPDWVKRTVRMHLWAPACISQRAVHATRW